MIDKHTSAHILLAKEKIMTTKLHDLFSLLLKPREELTDEEITILLTNAPELKDRIFQLWHSFPHAIEEVRRYRTRRSELEKLTTAELKEMSQEINQRRAAYLSAHDEEDIEDSFFESPPLDSKEHIIYEILRGREAEKEKVVTK